MDKSAAGVSSSNNAPSPGNFDYLNKKMRKVVIHAPGSYEQLKIEEHPIPRPGPGEVLIEVHAYGAPHRTAITFESYCDHVRFIFVGFVPSGFSLLCRARARRTPDPLPSVLLFVSNLLSFVHF